MEGVVAEKNSGQRGLRKSRDGVVVSNSMQKTVVVSVTRQVKHRKYAKFVRRSKKYYAHDETGQCGLWDMVRIIETRPLSRLKRWRVHSILTKAV